MEYRGAGRGKRALAASSIGPLRERYAPQGWRISGRASGTPASRCRAGPSTVSGAATASQSGSRRELLADESASTTARTRIPPSDFSRAVAERAGPRPRIRRSGLRGCLLLSVARTAPAGKRRSDVPRLEDALEASAPVARCSSRVWTAPRAMCCRSRAIRMGTHWQTGAWFLRDERCFLIPGDSPLGIPVAAGFLAVGHQPERLQFFSPPDPIQEFAPLPPYAEIRARLGTRCTTAQVAAQAARPPQQSAHWITRTAMCAEPRDGVLYVFMPPDRASRGLSRTGGGDRSHRRGSSRSR